MKSFRIYGEGGFVELSLTSLRRSEDETILTSSVAATVLFSLLQFKQFCYLRRRIVVVSTSSRPRPAIPHHNKSVDPWRLVSLLYGCLDG